MLRAYALADLFEANLDSTAEGIFLTTTGGNLIGLSPHLPHTVSKRLSILGALTWRFHAISPRHPAMSVGTSTTSSSPLTMAPVSMNGMVRGDVATRDSNIANGTLSRGMNSANPTADRTANPLPVLHAARGGTGLRELTVEYDARICALEYVREGLLVGAVSGVFDGKEQPNGNDSGEETGSDSTESEGAADRERSRRRERLVRLLTIKANAMAEYLREELKDFKMPVGLE